MTTTYNPTAQAIITEALMLLGVISPGMTVNGEDYSACLNRLNGMIKSWQTPPYGFHLWKIGKGSIFLNPGQTNYTISSSTTDHVGENAVVTQLSVAKVATDTALTVDDTTDMTIGDVIGVVQDDDTIKWTTIATIPTSTTLTISSGLASAAAINNNVYTYTSLASRPLEIAEVRLCRGDGSDIRMYELNKNNYYNITNKTNESSPIQYYLEPYKTYTKMYLYGTGSSSGEYVQFNYKKVLDDVTSSTDLVDFAQENIDCITWNLACSVAAIYEKEDKVAGGIGSKAQELFSAMVDSDQEKTSMKIIPNLWWY